MRFQKRWVREPNIRYFYFISLLNIFVVFSILVMFMPNVLMFSGLSVFLPRAVSSEPVSEKGTIITILGDNTVYLGKRCVTLKELSDFFHSQHNKRDQVLIKADQAASIGVLVGVWDLLRESGASKVNIATNG